MIEYMQFWFAKGLVELLQAFGVLGVFALVLLFLYWMERR